MLENGWPGDHLSIIFPVITMKCFYRLILALCLRFFFFNICYRLFTECCSSGILMDWTKFTFRASIICKLPRDNTIYSFQGEWNNISCFLYVLQMQTKTKQKPLKWNFKSSFQQSNHIYMSVQSKMMDKISASTMSHSNFLLFFDSL